MTRMAITDQLVSVCSADMRITYASLVNVAEPANGFGAAKRHIDSKADKALSQYTAAVAAISAVSEQPSRELQKDVTTTVAFHASTGYGQMPTNQLPHYAARSGMACLYCAAEPDITWRICGVT